MNFRGACVKPKYFFCILERVEGVDGEISMNPNDQCRSKLSWTKRLTGVLATAQTTRVLL